MIMRKFGNLLKWGLILGKEPQNFLGASWIPGFLNLVPKGNKRKWALRILGLSPHYFFDRDNPKYAGMTSDEFLETSFDINSKSRVEIYEKVLKRHLRPDFTVLEYGCGPGFVAKAVSPYVDKVFACDISVGALACAGIVNKGENIEYILADENGLSGIGDSSLDSVYSFAVIQHLTDEVFEIVLDNCHQKLKNGATIVFHIQLQDKVWKTEEEWKSDESVTGKLKYKYGLHCFGRTRELHRKLVEKHGFGEVEFESLKDLGNHNSSDEDSQYLMTAVKK
jgi:SAM-dependent methyltransferase